MQQTNQILTIEEAPMPPELQRQSEQFERNLDWFSAHAVELDVFNRYRGRHLAIAGGELFVGDSPEEVRQRAQQRHPDDHPFVHYILKEKAHRIYAFQRLLEAL